MKQTMIFDSLEILYHQCLDARLKIGLQFLREITDNTALGRHDIAGGCYAMIDQYTTVDENAHHFEAHRKHIDIHMLLCGEEHIQWCPLANMDTHTPYNDADDYALYNSTTQATIQNIVMVPRLIAVFYPFDAHRPGIISKQACRVRKAVVKVPV